MKRIKTFLLLVGEEFRLFFAFKRRYFFGSMTSFISNLIIMGGILLVSLPIVIEVG